MEGGGAEGVTRVLVVDDSPVDRKVVELVLGSNTFAGSFHVIAVDSAKKAMEFLGLKDGKEQAVDMVLTDYCMPEMTGYDLLKAIKAMSPLKPIPVIVMSSENEPQRISRCLKAGAEDYIVKPLQSKDVPRLRSCSNAKPKDPPCSTVSKSADHIAAVDGTSCDGEHTSPILPWFSTRRAPGSRTTSRSSSSSSCWSTPSCASASSCTDGPTAASSPT